MQNQDGLRSAAIRILCINNGHPFFTVNGFLSNSGVGAESVASSDSNSSNKKIREEDTSLAHFAINLSCPLRSNPSDLLRSRQNCSDTSLLWSRAYEKRSSTHKYTRDLRGSVFGLRPQGRRENFTMLSRERCTSQRPLVSSYNISPKTLLHLNTTSNHSKFAIIGILLITVEYRQCRGPVYQIYYFNWAI